MDSPTRTRQILVFLAGMVVAGLIFAGGRASAGVSFSDTPPWIQPHASWLAFQGIAGGYGDGTFRPDDNITRGQAAFWFGNYNDAIELVKNESNPSAGSQFTLTATCPLGKRAVAGGGHGDIPGNNLFVRDMEPDGAIWQVRWESDNDDLTVNPTKLSVWALCMPNLTPGSP